MDMVPRLLSSKPHVGFLAGLLLYLVLLPLTHLYTPSPTAMLIGGNYTNVTSDLGACIAAGGTVAALRHARKSHRIMADLYRHTTGRDHPHAPPPASKPAVNS